LANEIEGRAVEMAITALCQRSRVSIAYGGPVHPAEPTDRGDEIELYTFSACASGVSGKSADASAPGANYETDTRPYARPYV